MQILLFKGKGFISKLIEWQTRSKYSHAAMRFADGVCFEATHPAGVRTFRLEQCVGEIDVFDVEGVRENGEEKAAAFARAQLGKRYDCVMVLGFLFRHNQESRRDAGKWFCSELAFAVASQATEIFRNTEPWEVSPGLLPRSTALRYRETLKL